MTDEILHIDIIEDIFQISIDGANGSTSVEWDDIIGKPNSTPEEIDNIVNDGIISNPSGDWKRITSLEYNPITKNIRVSYEN
jgi:hypothetical protein